MGISAALVSTALPPDAVRLGLGSLACHGPMSSLINNTDDNTKYAADNRFKETEYIQRQYGIKSLGQHREDCIKQTFQCSKYAGCTNTLIAIHEEQTAAAGKGNGCLHAVDFKHKRFSGQQTRNRETDSDC